MICLFFFLLGAFLNFFMVAATIFSFARSCCKKGRKKNKVKHGIPKGRETKT